MKGVLFLNVNQLHQSFFVDGKKIEGKQFYELKNPYNLSTITNISLCSVEELEEAITSSQRAFGEMKMLPAHVRSEILYRTAELLEKRAEEFAQIISLEAGKPIKAARLEVVRSVQTFKFAAEEAKRIGGESIPMDAAKGAEGKIAFTVREPIGVVGAITPFNFPLNLVAHKVAPAIASGNTMVLKPAEQTPLSSLLLAEIMTEAGLIPGALNVVTGDGPTLGHVLNTDPRIKKISFTGSPEVGRIIQSKADFKKLTLELGSNAALIVDKHCDLETAVQKAVLGAFVYAGQVCIHTQRIYVHQEIFDAFLEKFVDLAKNLKVGAPQEETTDVSAVINQRSIDRILSWIEEAKASGAKVALGGEVKGQIIKPTVLTHVDEKQKVVCQEVFGPVVVINPIQSLEQGVQLTNQSRYGLNAGVFTNDLRGALSAAKELHVGQVLINEIPTFRADHMPYGGVKDSGVGREGIRYAIQEMTEEKLIVIHI